MSDEKEDRDEEELDGLEGELLPERAAMSVIQPPDGAIPLDDSDALTAPDPQSS